MNHCEGGAGGTERWYGEPALRVRGGAGLEALVVPGRGGKIVSLRAGAGREWLAQPSLPLPAPARPGASFVDAEMCGWDECVPTVDADVFEGAHLPDHGEAWTRAWSWQGDGWWGYEGSCLPYRFWRGLLPTAAGLRLAYRAEATGDRAVALLWTAHPQFAADPGSRVVLPTGVSGVLGVHGVLGSLQWTDALSQVDALAPGEARKVWLQRGTRASWVALESGDGAVLRLSWNPSLVGYLGVWVDAGAYSREPVVALEPSTGWFDRPSRAVAEKSCPWLSPGRPLEWWLDIDVKEGGTS